MISCLQTLRFQLHTGYCHYSTVGALTCPEPKCGAFMLPAVLRGLLPEDQFARWERLTLERTLDQMADLVYCPRCEAAVIEDEGGDNCGKGSPWGCHYHPLGGDIEVTGNNRHQLGSM